MAGAPVPVLLVTGFLGAGKTTVVNHLLAHAGGRRIAAVVNDFGAINIDAELIAGASDGVVSLANGCICCTLEGDLLRTLATLLRRDPRPEAILIETSGVADPADIVRNLMDPLILREAPLETVLCVVDAAAPPGTMEDPLLRAQLRLADVVALSKTDLADEAGCARIRAAVAALRPAATVIEAPQGEVPLLLVLPDDPARLPTPRNPARRDPGRSGPRAERFETLSWTAEAPLSIPLVQAAIGRLAPRLARAKGVFEAVQQPGRPLLFQLAGGRATLVPMGEGAVREGLPCARIVFIAEVGRISPEEIRAEMERSIAEPSDTRNAGTARGWSP
ncbi:CobW family GTP-binding protein [Roseomonas populi]|uniref:GTP-binding protein n=1 Tax=Roseomonas populi TaxID=3121582 RepID=A0ABT1XC16_9PROT|nr:GTP-binding protein [Roseomonas pecuniae]MCR0984948.1 GTP-binding protein [Roseomonas pecuniae]